MIVFALVVVVFIVCIESKVSVVVVVVVWVQWRAGTSMYSHHWVLFGLHFTHCFISTTLGAQSCTCWSVSQL